MELAIKAANLGIAASVNDSCLAHVHFESKELNVTTVLPQLIFGELSQSSGIQSITTWVSPFSRVSEVMRLVTWG